MISPDVPGMIGVTPDARVAHPSPLKKCREGHQSQKAEARMGDIWWLNGTMLHELNSIWPTPPPHGLNPLKYRVWNTGLGVGLG